MRMKNPQAPYDFNVKIIILRMKTHAIRNFDNKCRKKILFLWVLFFFVSCNTEGFNTFILEGVAVGVEDFTNIELVYIIKKGNDWYRIKDSTEIINEKFRFVGSIDDISPANLYFSEIGSVQIFLEPMKMSVCFNKDEPYKRTLLGSKSEKDYQILKKGAMPYEAISYKKLQILLPAIEKVNTMSSDTAGLYHLTQRINDDILSLDMNRAKIDSVCLDFAIHNSTSQITPYILYSLLQNERIDSDTIEYVYNSLPISVKNNLMGQLANRQLEKNQMTKSSLIGAFLPDFIREDVSGSSIRLSDFYGKEYVLLDFWASWCGPCLKEIPVIKNLHEKYKNKGLAVIGISLDDEKKYWLESIEKNKLNNWTQILAYEEDAPSDSLLLFSEEDLADLCNISEIPFYILIDKEGKVLARWEHLGHDQLKWLEDLLQH